MGGKNRKEAELQTGKWNQGLGINKVPWLWILGAGSWEFVQWRKSEWREKIESWLMKKSEGMGNNLKKGKVGGGETCIQIFTQMYFFP